MSKRKGDFINGLLLLDKPTGMSSNKALQIVKRAVNARKAGHTGSLDPLATGMLPLCLGEASKFSQYLLSADKRYVCTAKCGVITDSGDSDGNMLEERPVPHISEADLQGMLYRFTGPIQQRAPIYSALKYQGKPLYYYARQGIDVPRKVRQVTIKALSLLALTADTFTIAVECSKGTYIRSLIEDIGEMLGCGAHVTMLRREWVTPFAAQPMHHLQIILEAVERGDWQELLLPVDQTVQHFEAFVVPEEAVWHLQQGQHVTCERPDLSLLRLYSPTGHFLGLGECLAGKIVPRRMMSSA